MAARLGIVIVNYRTADLVIACVRSLREATPRPGVVLVDNGSGDGSAERIAAAIKAEDWSNWVWLSGHLLWLLRSRLLGSIKRAPPMLLGDFLRYSVLVRGFSL